MDAQLRLLNQDDIPPGWRLDRDTRQIGLRGVALARQALHEARRARFEADEASAA